MLRPFQLSVRPKTVAPASSPAVSPPSRRQVFGRTLSALILIGQAALAWTALQAEDELELLSGMKVRGTVLEEASDSVTFLCNGAQMKFDLQKIHALLNQSMNALATAYAELQQDWARAAYWWRKGGGGGHGYDNEVALARCYLNLGNRDMAVASLTSCRSLSDDVARLWFELGDVPRALQLSEQIAQSNQAMGNLVGGDIARGAGRYPEAMNYYQKVLNLPDPSKFKQARSRAQASLDAIKYFEMMNLKKIPDGTYSSDSYGYSGQVYVTVMVKAGKIEDCKVTQHTEKQYYGSLADTPARIIEKQGVKGVDTFSSATITSEAIINASAKALATGMK